MLSPNNHRTLFALSIFALLGLTLPDARAQQSAAAKPDTHPPAGVECPKPPSVITTPQGVELVPSAHGLEVLRAKESYTTLTLEGSELKPQPPLSTDHEKNADFERELVRVQWRPSDPIDMYIVKPPNAMNPPVVLFLDGYSRNLDTYRDNTLCKYLVKNGTAAVGFESAHAGYRAERGPLNQWFVSVLPESLTESVHDVQLILDYLTPRGDLDMTRVGMFAEGSGASIAILAAATDHRLNAIDLLNPWGDWPDWLAKSPVIPDDERANYLKPDFLARVATLDPVSYLPNLTSCAVRITLWDDVNSKTKEATAKLEAAAPENAKITHYPTAFSMALANGEGRMFVWLASTLTQPKPGGKNL